ncbi:MAG: DNA-directed RNA polymerase subunit N, partial [Nitrososphaerota archaeon]
EEYVKKVEMGEEPGKVLDSLGIKRYCCRRMFLTHYEYYDEIVSFHTLYGYKEQSE